MRAWPHRWLGRREDASLFLYVSPPRTIREMPESHLDIPEAARA